MKTLLVFDCDGVLRDESQSYQRCIVETVAFFDAGKPATQEELVASMKASNDDWERTHTILKQRQITVPFYRVKEHFQDLYLGKARDFTGYINNEPWLADNELFARLAKLYPLAIVSGAPQEEVRYTLQRNQALEYFSLVLGMNDCLGKKDGLEKAITHFTAEQVLFCDDRPKPIADVRSIPDRKIRVFGIMPPQTLDGWYKTLTDAGAEQVFKNVRDYCRFLISSGL